MKANDNRKVGAVFNTALVFPALFCTCYHFYELSKKPVSKEQCYLCDTCISALRGKNKIKDHSSHGSHSLSDYHHQKYEDLVVSKDNNCFVCTWLWNKLPILPDSDSSKIDGFRIYCTVNRPNLKFLAVYPWAMNVVLKVSMCAMEDLGSRGSSPPPIWTLLDAQPWTDLDDHMGASRSLHQVEAWLSSCEAGHEYCLSHGWSPGKYFPTRVIDVDRVEDGTVYLRERSEVKTGFLSEGNKAGDLRRGYPAYWTLSHRWGDPELIQQLSQSTENQLRSGMGVSDLSPTFCDSCLLVRRMGYRYIWIDSLCIFQDSLSEWQQEAKAMVDVYRHSFCKISTIGAPSNPSSVGLFSRRRLPLRLLFFFQIHGQHLDDERGFRVGPWVVFNDSIWTDDVASTPLSTRGWAVQERFLAPQVLHFTENQIYWECLETTILAKDWHLRPPIQTVYKAVGREIARSLSKVLLGQQYITWEEETAYLTLWGDLVSIYANCALTNESDRLIAMSGIAKSFQEANKDTYLAGLWKKVIHSDLAWKTDASDGAKVFRSDSSGIPVSLINLVAKRIVSEPPGSDPTGLLRSAELDIECMLYYYRWTSQSTTLAVFKDEARHDCYFRKEFGSQHLHLDTANMARKFKEMAEVEGVCVPLWTTFRRIGTFEHGEIGRLISEWSVPGTRITLL
ncbi:heterokaryon incompatibility protein-domain-containing protein [Fusarium oxysporum Fo47]|uniref:heterokaryon incompatibility protein-domain-containing protein n=1 Tax=Fusarium oxysporum Fo47 TaxID=660027 RepID=UPI002869A1CC|nr:heterokaryon incompatibility protein-domain-containing protein [Fusarium oxysporum Fo47]QKD53936.2 heterokaryon incompatibility protein-domain-containing protein [Fusarium oxysporum Fo47]